jgi:hypothetical protein
MLLPAKSLERHEIVARDGTIGHVADFYFDDQAWTIRYAVVDTGKWLTGRRVLLAPSVISRHDHDQRQLHVDLTQEQVRQSPGAETDRPVSRQHELALQAHYGWPAYWGTGAFGAGAYPAPLGAGIISPVEVPEAMAPLAGERRERDEPPGDPHLRSTHEARGYRIAAADGAIGHLEDFLIHPASWKIRYAVVDTRNWWPGRKVIVATSWITRVSWTEQSVHVDLTREAIRSGPEYDASQPLSREYVDQLHEHYQRPRDDAW